MEKTVTTMIKKYFTIQYSQFKIPREVPLPVFGRAAVAEETPTDGSGFGIGVVFEEAGGEHFTYIPCLNDNDAHIAALSNVIHENLQGWI